MLPALFAVEYEQDDQRKRNFDGNEHMQQGPPAGAARAPRAIAEQAIDAAAIAR